jgi:hypothetical protein
MLTDFLVKLFSSNPDEFFFSLFSGRGAGDLPDDFGETFATVRAFFIVLDAILLFGFIFALIKGWKYRPHLHPWIGGHGTHHGGAKGITTLRDQVVRERWLAVLKKAAAGTPDALKISIIDADKLVDDVLKQMGLAGEHMADRLEKLSAEDVRSLERLWRAHRLRNNLVHSLGFQISAHEAKQALENYEVFLKELKLLA